ncbi:MAG: branched-chain amino acid transport system ATP-binding protein livF [Actinomycetota bacterium]
MTRLIARSPVVRGAAASLVVWIVAAWLLPRGLPTGIVLLGAVTGSLYGLIAVGIVLVYRANRVINFAQAELGALAAVVTLYLATARGWNYFAALAVGLGLAAGSGALVERVILRRFARKPRLIVTVVTIGVAQVLNGLSILLALQFSGGASAGTFETPFSPSFTLSPVVFKGDHILVLLVVPAVLVGLTLLLRRTDYGIAIRAVADSPDRSRLLGLPVHRLSTLVWTAAAVLSAVGIILRIPLTGFVSFTAVSGGGTALLLRALAAAVIARMDNLGVAVLAAVGLGIVESGAAWTYGNTAYADGVLVVVILVALMAQRGRFSRITHSLSATAAYQAIREVRPVPAELRDLREIRYGALGGRLLVVIAAVSLPLWASPSRTQLASLVLIYALVAVSLVVLTGWAGHVSLGHWALVGVGGTTCSLLFTRHGLDLFVAAGAAVAVTALVALLIGLPALRVQGPFLAITTLAFAVTASTLLFNLRYLPWFAGDRIGRPALLGRIPIGREWQLYYVVLVAIVLTIAAVQSLRRSRSGRALIALRDNEPNAAAFGIPPTRLKLGAFMISGAIAGLAGVLYALHQGGIRQDAFDPAVGLRIFSMVVIGGLGSVAGAVLGAVFVRGAEYFLEPGLALIASGAGILIILLVSPGGIGEVLYRVRDRLLRWVADRRGVIVPSLVSDRVVRETGDGPAPPTRAGTMLSVRGLDVAYDGVQVLFGVDLDVDEGEIVALLGTNGAGKSTVLNAISGLVAPEAGQVTIGGEDFTGASTSQTVESGIVMVPGGRGVFPSLTVAENFRIAAWSQRQDRAHVQAATERALAQFPVLRDRWEQPAGLLSGGEQQMLNLSQALLARPRLLLVDELTMGLAPLVVEHLLEIVAQIHRDGATVVIVEQSVNTALRLAERAVFMEKGEVRFSGPTAELLERPDILRAVYLTGAESSNGATRTKATRSAGTNGGNGDVVLSVDSLRKRFGGLVATDNVSFDLHAGEILGLIGPNGAGKTTLFDLINGFVAPDSGRVRLGSDDVTMLPSHERARAGLGRSFQDARLWPSLTVAEAIATACEAHVRMPGPVSALLGLPAVAESEALVSARVEELVEVLGLGAFRDKFMSELSTGSRRIVEIAAMLAQGPSVLLLDEPSSGIAQREAEALGPMLRDLRDRLGCSMVVIDHHMPVVLELADRLVALDQGAVVTTGTPEAVLEHPRVVESYLGVPTSPPAPIRTGRCR